MKKIVFIFLALTGFIMGHAQSTCGTAASFAYPISRTVTSYTNSQYWFTVTMGPGNFLVNVTSASLANKMTRADVYTGTCVGLTECALDTVVSTSTDSVLQVSITNTVATSYTFKLTNGGSNTTFTVNATTFLSIVGDIGFCPGAASIALTANVLNQGSSPYTYTWSPGGATTNSISVSSPSPATYTLTYHDGGGTYTTTITTFTLN